MRYRFLLLAMAVLAAILPGGPARAAAVSAAKGRLVIRPAADADWQASLRDVEKVLYSAAEQLWVFFPRRSLDPILVEPKRGPITLFKRGPNGEYRMRLATGSTYWAQYAFQFSHEFCHVLCNYRPGNRRNKWFEESLCETASLFVLRRMAEKWKTDPPYPNWRSFAASLRSYADERLQECPLPEDTTLAKWYRDHAQQLRENPVLRENNRVVAAVLLPLFEQQPEHWQAIAYLNGPQPAEDRTFTEYLQDWHNLSPPKHQPFVRRIAAQFGIRLSHESGQR